MSKEALYLRLKVAVKIAEIIFWIAAATLLWTAELKVTYTDDGDDSVNIRIKPNE